MLPLGTAFDPIQHGFHFSNDDIEWEIHPGSVVGKNLCGGMIYAALDSFLYRRTIPSDTKPPARRTSLNSYIYDRQISAHIKTVPQLTFGFSWFVDSLAGEFDKLRKRVEKYYPVPLFLVKEGSLHGHHVLVIGCQSSPSTGNPILDVYDPNYEDEVTTIHVEYGAKRFTLKGTSSADRGAIKGFFVDEGYKAQMPPW